MTLPPGLYQHLHFEGPFAVRIDAGHSFRMISRGEQIENQLFWGGYYGGYEPMSLRTWAALCRGRDGLIIDIGANAGLYALAAKALAADAQVVAFEPIERFADELARNVALNGFSITIERKAVSDRNGTLPIFDHLDGPHYATLDKGLGEGPSYDVPVVTLDGWLATHPKQKVSAVKIDIERHEPAAIRGMRALLAGQRPPILIEILDESVGAGVGRLIDGLGYRRFHIDERKGLIPAQRLCPVGERNWNHLLCTSEEFESSGLHALLAP